MKVEDNQLCEFLQESNENSVFSQLQTNIQTPFLSKILKKFIAYYS